jgi:hypothetical protein
MDRNQDLGSNAEISLSCGTDIFDLGRQTDISDSDDRCFIFLEILQMRVLQLNYGIDHPLSNFDSA